MECYLDNSATTRVDEEVTALMHKIMLEDYGNPASLHRKGFEAEKHIRTAKETLAGILKCKENELIFTSGGTESDNTALLGAYFANSRRGNHIITTKIEHPAVSEAAKYLETLGARVDYLDVDEAGHISINRLEDLLCDNTVLVSVMHVNNEIGSEEPIAEIGRLINQREPECLFHVDDVQGFGKIRLIPKDCHVDLLSASSHKIHGPKGAGLLYKSERAKITPLIHGGGHQRGYRSGTENVPGVAGFALAASMLYKDIESSYAHMEKLKESFMGGISEIDNIKINGGDVPYIISLSIKDIRSEVLLHALEEKGIYVSAGSACSSNKPRTSATMKAIGAEHWQLDSTIRISLSPHTTEEEMHYAAEQLKVLVPQLRKFVRK
ncbi:MAG: cysteine desulfurase [Lachnospiraceae bacterium]|nr:cysteine desulfurase [Lachnospiraceae bacterium]